MAVLLTVKAQLSLQKQKIAKEPPEAREYQDTGDWLWSRKLQVWYSVSHKRAPWSMQQTLTVLAIEWISR